MAPSRDLLGVPSRSIRVRSIAPCSRGPRPVSARAISSLTLSTARETPLPAQLVAPVAQLRRLELAGRCTRGHGRAPDRPGVQGDVHLDCRVAPRVEDLAGVDELDGRHGRGSLCLRRARRGSAARPPAGRAPGPPQAAGHVHELEQGLADPALGGLAGLVVAEPLPRLLARRARPRRPAAASCGRRAAPGRFSGTSANGSSAPRPSSSRLIRSQLRRTSPAVSASASPNTCGWRRMSFCDHRLGDLGQAAGAALLEQAARGSRPGTARRRARRGASRRHRPRPRRRARTPPRPCGGRSSARPARGPTGTRGAGGG